MEKLGSPLSMCLKISMPIYSADYFDSMSLSFNIVSLLLMDFFE